LDSSSFFLSSTDPRAKIINYVGTCSAAISSTYYVPVWHNDENSVRAPKPKKLFIEKVPLSYTSDMLQKELETCGAIEEIYVSMHPLTGKSLGIASVTFMDWTHAKKALASFDGRRFPGAPESSYISFDSNGDLFNAAFAKLTLETVRIGKPRFRSLCF
jgi:RNA recognition motif-containing protein